MQTQLATKHVKEAKHLPVIVYTIRSYATCSLATFEYHSCEIFLIIDCPFCFFNKTTLEFFTWFQMRQDGYHSKILRLVIIPDYIIQVIVNQSCFIQGFSDKYHFPGTLKVHHPFAVFSLFHKNNYPMRWYSPVRNKSPLVYYGCPVIEFPRSVPEIKLGLASALHSHSFIIILGI